MSGIEIAGLVLGAVPLIISAIEHYESSLNPVMAFFKWKDELEKAMRELWILHSYYEMTMRNLLIDVTTDAQLDEMLSRPESPLWKSSKLNEELRHKLGAAYRVYDYTIQEMGGHMRILASHLDIDRANTPTADDLDAILQANRPIAGSQQLGRVRFEFRRRVKLTMKRRDIRQLLQKVKECNDRLDLFIEKAGKFEHAASPQQAEGRRNALSMPLHQICSHVTDLHQVLSKAWTCGVHSSHRAYLMLEHRVVRRGRKNKPPQTYRSGDDQDPDRATFTLFFKNTEQSGIATWYVAEVRVLDEPVLPARVAGIRFEVSDASATATPLSSSGLDNITKMGIVQDICLAFQSVGHSCLRFCLDVTSESVLRGTSLAAQRPVCLGDDLVTLEDVLFPTHTKWRPLTEEDRYLLAITLAASFLQLHKTPWMSDRWSERDILFAEETATLINTKSTESTKAKERGKRVDVQHPFITKTYVKAINTPSTTTPPPGTSIYSKVVSGIKPSSHDDSVNLLTLAKILLEIQCSSRIEDLRRFEDLGPSALPNEATDLQTLKRWIEQEKGNISFAFRGAIAYCMKGFADPDTDLNDVAFRQSVVESVVVPLLEELHYFQEGFLSRS